LLSVQVLTLADIHVRLLPAEILLHIFATIYEDIHVGKISTLSLLLFGGIIRRGVGVTCRTIHLQRFQSRPLIIRYSEPHGLFGKSECFSPALEEIRMCFDFFAEADVLGFDALPYNCCRLIA
jgi:hypothetical protein